MKQKNNFQAGFKDGIPIGLGYFAVAFSLGIAAKHAGLTPFQGFMASLLENASAGEYVAFTMIAANATYLEMAIGTLITNARYLLMSASLAQRLHPETSLFHRFAIAFGITDELFGIGIIQIQSKGPYYMYGAFLAALPAWALGTALGILAGTLLPVRIVSALSVALYGMFLAIIIPPAKNNKIIRMLVIIGFLSSFIWQYIPILNNFSSGTKTIVLTLIIATLAAFLFPRKEDPYAS